MGLFCQWLTTRVVGSTTYLQYVRTPRQSSIQIAVGGLGRDVTGCDEPNTLQSAVCNPALVSNPPPSL